MPSNNDIVRAIGDAIVQAAEYVNRDANDYSKSSIKNARIYGNQIKQNSVPGFVLKDGSIPGLKIVDLDFAKIKNVEIGNAHIANAGIDYAKIKDLHADSAYFGSQIFELGLGDELYIGRLRVNAANIAHLEVGELILESPDGTLYRLGVDEDGNVVTSVYEVQYQNIADMTKNLMSQYTIYRGTTPPETPYVGQLWVNTDTDIIKRCIAVTPEVIWEPVKASELHTSFINAVERGLEILSTGVIEVKNGGNIDIQSGGSLSVRASGSIDVESGGAVSLKGGASLTLSNTDGDNLIDMDEDGLKISSGSKIEINDGSGGNAVILDESGISVESEGKINVKSGASIVLDGGDIDIRAGGAFSVLSGNFSIDESGDVSVVGKITSEDADIKGRVVAESGEIGGFVLDGGSLKDKGANGSNLDINPQEGSLKFGTAISIDKSNFNVSSGGGFNLQADSGDKAIGISSSRSDEYFFWGGNEDPALAPLSAKRNGDFTAKMLKLNNTNLTEITNANSQHFIEQAQHDALPGTDNFPAVFDFYIPNTTAKVVEVGFTFKLTPYRADSKGTYGGAGVAIVTGISGIPQGSVFEDHYHNMDGYAEVDGHQHPIKFGIYENNTLPSSVSLLIDGVDRTSILGGNTHLEDYDIVDLLLTDEDGLIKKGWHSIKVYVPEGHMARVVAHLYSIVVIGTAMYGGDLAQGLVDKNGDTMSTIAGELIVATRAA